MAETQDPLAGLTPGARQLIETASRPAAGEPSQRGLNHWLIALLEKYGPMAETVAKGVNAPELLQHCRKAVREGRIGDPVTTESVLQKAHEIAKARGRSAPAERDVVAAILAHASYELVEPTSWSKAPATSAAPTAAPATTPSGTPPAGAPAPAAAGYNPVAKRPTPTIEKFGRDLTRAAQEGKLPAVVGRDTELQLMIETLCRRTKRNPVLVGPAGVGKTAIVEALAQKIVRGDVPEAIQGSRVLAIQPSSLVAGAGVVGELDQRVTHVIGEASQAGILLFIDEVHSMVGAGGREGSGDIASLLKPALARGELAVIAATTDEEYRRFIEKDAALERRFQPVPVQELTASQTLGVLGTVRDELGKLRGVAIPDEVMAWLVDFADQYLPMRRFPDKAIDLLEQCVAYGVTQGRKTLSREDAEAVAQRVVGMPLDLDKRREALRKRLNESALLGEKDIAALVDRLAVTGRGLDVRPHRPNAIVLLTGEIADQSDVLAEMIAAELFGSESRVVALDLGRIVHPADVNLLVGAPPGYVGYNEGTPMHKVAQMPWCVVRFENVHACHPQVHVVLSQAFADGFLADASGKKIPLSNTIVLMTAELGAAGKKPAVMGFNQAAGTAPQAPAESEALAEVERLVGRDLANQVDIVWSGPTGSPDAWRHWLKRHLLEDLKERYKKQGVELAWDESVVDWLLKREVAKPSRREWERVVDQHLNPFLVGCLARPDARGSRLLVKCEGDRLTAFVQALGAGADSGRG